MSLPSGFNTNEFSYTNNTLLKLYDALSVIDYSLRLIENHGRNEFESVIMQQLRMIFTKGNNYYEDDIHLKRGLSKDENSFSLFDVLGDGSFVTPEGDKEKVREIKMFPKIKIAYRDYHDRINSDSKYFHYTNKSIIENDCYNIEEFLKQQYIRVEDANGNEKYKSVEQCIKLLANKLQGAHYQVHIKKIQLDIIQRSNIIAQTLGMVTTQILLPMVKHILLQDDKMVNNDGYAQYMNKDNYISFDVYSATPIFDEP